MAEFDPDAFLARSEKREKKSAGFDPDAFLKKTQPETALQTFGRSTASMADSALNALTGTLDYGAYALARAAGRSPEQATAETTSPKDVVGRAFGVTGTPGYENAPLRTVGNVIGEKLGENVVAPIAGATGLPEADVGSMVNSAMIGLGPAVPKVAGAVKPVVKGGVEFGKGAYSGAFNTTAKPTANPANLKPWETPSARMPVGDTYIPADVLEQFRAGTITPEQAQAAARPITELPQDALARTQGMVPYKGQAIQAAGEQFGAGYRDPYKLAAEVGSDYLFGGIPTLGRLGLKGYDAYKLGQAYNELGKAGFTPLTPTEFGQLRSAGPVAPGGGGGGVRQQAAARINTQALPPDVVAAQEAAANARVAAAEAAARERQQQVSQPVDPAVIAQQQAQAAAEAEAIAQQKAAAKAKAEQMAADIMAKRQAEQQAAIGEVSGPVAPTRDIVPFESAEARAAKAAEARAETPLTTREKLDKTLQSAYGQVSGRGKVLNKELIDQTLAGEGLPPVDWSKLGTDYQSMSVKDGRKAIQKFVETEAGLRGAGTRGPTQKTQMKEANERLAYEQSQRSPEEVAKELADMQAAIERRKRVLGDKYRAPGGSRFEMMTGEPEVPKAQVFADETDFRQQQSFDKIAGIPTEGTWQEGNKTIHSQSRGWPFDPTKVDIFATDTATGKRVPRGVDWTEADPKPSGVETAEKIRANLNKKSKPSGTMEMKTAEPDGTFQNPYLDKEDAKHHVFSSRIEGNKYHRAAWKEDGNLREYTENPQEAEVSTKRPDGSSQRIVRETVINRKTGEKSYKYNLYEFDPDWNSTGDVITSKTKPDWWPW
jgi:hypothetical protein